MNKSKSIVKQASLLAIAGILVRFIGVLYRSPLKSIISEVGNGYYSTAYEIYALVLLLSSYSIPTAISKLISEKNVLKQYNNARKILKCAFIYIFVVGGCASLFAFILAPLFLPEHAVLSFRVLCPTIFFSGILGIFRGYFQAHHNTLYTSISQIIEQIFNAIVSILAAYLFVQPYVGVDANMVAVVGSAGSALGTGAGVLVGLFYMILMFIKKGYKKIEDEDQDLYEDSTSTIFKMILQIVTPIIFSTCVYNSVTTIEMAIYYFIKGNTPTQTTAWGIFAGEYIVLRNVPVALASALSTASIPSIASSFTIKDYKETKTYIHNGERLTMMILIPAAVGMGILAYPILSLIFPQAETIQTSTMMLYMGTIGIVFYGLSTYTNGVLQAIGEVNIPLKNAIIALITQSIVCLVLLLLTPLDLYSLVIANCFYAMHVCYLNHKVIKEKLNYKQSKKKIFLIPIIASFFMAIIVLITYHGLKFILHMVAIPLVLSVIIGIITYFAVIFYFYIDHIEELDDIPYASRLLNKFKHKKSDA